MRWWLLIALGCADGERAESKRDTDLVAHETGPPYRPRTETAAPPTTDAPGAWEHVCAGGATYLYAFPYQLQVGDTQPAWLWWEQDASYLEQSGYPFLAGRSSELALNANGYVMASCSYVEAGSFAGFSPERWTLIVE